MAGCETAEKGLPNVKKSLPINRGIGRDSQSLEHAGYFPITAQFGMSELFKVGNAFSTPGIFEPARSPLLSGGTTKYVSSC